MEKTLNATEQEIAVMKVIADTMEMYGDGFSDVMVEDIVAETGLKVNTVKGLLGSLYKKNYIDMMDVNGEYNVYYLSGNAKEYFGVDFD